MTEEEYSKKTGTVQDFMKKNKMGKYNPEEVARLEKEKAEADRIEKEAASKITVEDRCEVRIPGQPTRRGMQKVTLTYLSKILATSLFTKLYVCYKMAIFKRVWYVWY